MKKFHKLIMVALVVSSVAWAIFTMRPEVLFLSVVFLLLLFYKKFRDKKIYALIFLGAIVAVPFLPIGLTLTNMPGSPKIVSCCHYSLHEASIKEECIVCTDLVTGFEAKYYIVW